jgi:hypothetical protein
MSRSKALVEQSSAQRSRRWMLKRVQAFRRGAGPAVAALTAALAITACDEIILSTSNLQIAPNPAGPGDAVVASFILDLVPLQQHTIIVLIDDTEYLRVTRNEQPPFPVVVELGDAAELIARYGPGPHVARIEVRADENNEITRTAPTSFVLEETSS